MVANIRTIGLSGLARALVQHDRLQDAEAQGLTHEAKAANSSFRERLIASGRMGTREVAEGNLDGTWQPWSSVGCDHCKGTGYRGSVAIFQVMPVTEEIQRIIMRGGNAIEIAEQAHLEGVRDLRQAEPLKVRQGLTSLEEVMAVTNK